MKYRSNYSFILFLILLAGLWVSLFAKTNPTNLFSHVEFDLEAVSLDKVGALGIPVDHYDASTGRFVNLVVSHYGIEKLTEHGIPHRVLIDDYSRYIEQRNNLFDRHKAAGKVSAYSAVQPPENWKHGSMGGYFHFEEVIDEIDEMREKFPELISEKFEIGRSHEDRPIWAVRLSNSPDEMDADRINVVYNTLTHPREPMAMMSMMWYLWDILEKYGEDEDITKIFDYMEIYYIPVVNPDGFEHNYATNPNGGGLWRKNRRDHGNGEFGVDINRNYSVNWGNNAGSSPNIRDGTYRGEDPFSEPENQAIEAFYELIQPAIASTFHCYANVLLIPYGISGVPDNVEEYNDLSDDMTAANGWEYGRVPPTIGYQAAGIEIDWAHDVIGAMGINPEMGRSSDGGFWPPEDNIDRLAESGYVMNLAMAKFMFPEIVTTEKADEKVIGNKITDTFSLDVNVARGQLNIGYQILDDENSWQLTLRDLQGKLLKRFNLSSAESSVNLSLSQFPSSLYLLNVSSCNNTGCQKVHTRKLVK